MGRKQRRAQDRNQMDAALDRWEDEGGAHFLSWILKYQSGDLDDKERRILECLGAAVVSEWNELPRDYQRALFQKAAVDKPYDPAQLRLRIARFLHNHKDDADTG
jgi:hypothetical protein